jgi:hypothetical protein
MNLLSKISHLPKDKQREVLLKVKASMYRGSLFNTATRLLEYPDVNWQTHGEMINTLESEAQNKLIVMPRGTLKSTLGVVAFAIWRLIQNPDLRILIDSELQQNSKTFLTEIKAQICKPEFIELFGDPRYYIDPKDGRVRKTKWSETEIVLSQRKKKHLKEASITAAGVGTTKVGQHYDLIIGDDYNSKKNSQTPEARLKVIDHYKMNTSILEPGGEIVLIGTRYAADDVIGWVIDNEIGTEEAKRLGIADAQKVA